MDKQNQWEELKDAIICAQTGLEGGWCLSLQAWYCCSAWDPQVPEVHRVAHQEAAFPATCQRNCTGFQDRSAFPECSYWSPTGRKLLVFTSQIVCLTLQNTLIYFLFCRKQVRHTWLDCLRTPICVLFMQRGLPSCPKIFSWPGELEGSVHKCGSCFYLGAGWPELGLVFVNQTFTSMCATSFLYFHFINYCIPCSVELHSRKCCNKNITTQVFPIRKSFFSVLYSICMS